MIAQLALLPGAISEMLAQVSASGVVTLADRYGLMAAVLDESLSEEEQYAINRLLRSIQRGNLKLVDDLSALS